MEPRIQYAKTSDGVNIAYYALGQGVPFVSLGLPSHLSEEWTVAGEIYEQLAKELRFVRLDPRGFGLSDRDCDDLSLPGFVQDIEAVVDKLELPRFVLLSGTPPTTPIAIAFTAAHPDRVASLILSGGAKTPDLVREQFDAILNVPGLDWRSTSESIARIIAGWDDQGAASTIATLLRTGIDREGFSKFTKSLGTWDVTELLPDIQTRTLVESSIVNSRYGLEAARELAAGLPNAQLVVFDGATSAENVPQRLAAVRRFLGAPEEPQDRPLPEGTTVILFLDIADSTTLTTKLGDAAYREKERALDTSLRTAITDAGGTPLEGKLLGDGILSVYASASQAIDAAQRCRDIGNQADLPLHLGIHAGDVIHEENDVRGGAVQLAARVQSMAATGEILVSDIVRGLARTSAGVEFEDRGEHTLKGIDEPQRLFAVRAD